MILGMELPETSGENTTLSIAYDPNNAYYPFTKPTGNGYTIYWGDTANTSVSFLGPTGTTWSSWIYQYVTYHTDNTTGAPDANRPFRIAIQGIAVTVTSLCYQYAHEPGLGYCNLKEVYNVGDFGETKTLYSTF